MWRKVRTTAHCTTSIRATLFYTYAVFCAMCRLYLCVCSRNKRFKKISNTSFYVSHRLKHYPRTFSYLSLCVLRSKYYLEHMLSSVSSTLLQLLKADTLIRTSRVHRLARTARTIVMSKNVHMHANIANWHKRNHIATLLAIATS
jgi:hypothetical protein